MDDARGGQLYFDDGDQTLDLRALGLDYQLPKDHVEIGPVKKIHYLTTKDFHDFEPVHYHHKFGEEGNANPRLRHPQQADLPHWRNVPDAPRRNCELMTVQRKTSVASNPQRKRKTARRKPAAKRNRHAHKAAPTAAKAANPRKRRAKPMAARKTKAASTSTRRRSAPRRKSNPTRRRRTRAASHRRRRNPTLRVSRAGSLAAEGVTALVALVATRQLPQMLLGQSNAGSIGSERTS